MTVKTVELFGNCERLSYIINRESINVESIVIEDCFRHLCPIRVRVRVPAAPEYEYDCFNARTVEFTEDARWTLIWRTAAPRPSVQFLGTPGTGVIVVG